jgi:nucleotide-binding universal stress UspA family protein
MDLARCSGARLLLLRAAQAHRLLGVESTDAQVRVIEEAEEYLRGVSERLATQGVSDAEPLVWYGGAAYAIIEAARYRKVDLIVMTTHGRSGLGRLIMGSVAESVLRGTATPILLIRPQQAPVVAPPVRELARPWSIAERPS